MADYDGLTPGQVLADASVADFIKSLGLGIAEAQRALDTNSVEQLDAFITPIDGLGGRTLFEMGLQPAFYHYQHADLSCSLQLTLKVEKEFGLDFGINGSFNNAGTENDSSDVTEQSSESGTRSDSQQRTARIEISTSTQGALTVNGGNFQLTGDSPRERIENLGNALRGSQDIDRALITQETTPVNPTTNADPEKVVCSPNAVAFIEGGFHAGFIRIRTRPSGAVDYKLNDSTTVNAARGNTAEQHAENIKDRIIADTPFRAIRAGRGGLIENVKFEHDSSVIRPNYDASLRAVARMLKATGINVTLHGHTDRSGPQSYNLPLSERRATVVRDRLIAYGVPASQITAVRFTGEQRWADEGVANGTRNEDHRLVEILLDSDDHIVAVGGGDSNVLENVTPDQIGANDTGANGWIYLFNPATGLASEAGKTVTIKSVAFTLSGAAAGGHAENSGAAFALNLANAVNANSGVRVAASAQDNVCELANEGDNYRIDLLTSSSRNITMTGSSDVRVTEQFSRSRTARTTQNRTGNQTVAVGASLDIHYSRKFEMNVTGNSAISARLVSVPAPPQFLETIREFLEDRQQG